MSRIDAFLARLMTRGLRYSDDQRVLEVAVGELVSFTIGDEPQAVPAASYYRRIIRIPGRPMTGLCRTGTRLVIVTLGKGVRKTTIDWQNVLTIEPDADNVLAVRSIGPEGWWLIRWRPAGGLADGFVARLRAQQAARLDELTAEDRALNALNTGSARCEQGDLDGARAAWVRAMEAGGEIGTVAALNLGIVAVRAGELAAARHYYRQAIEYGHPAHAPKAIFNLALLVYDDGDIATSAAMLREVIDSGDPELSGRAAEALARLEPDAG